MPFSFEFNSHSGYLEGIVRGYKNGLLKSSEYLSLTQCETLDDLNVSLQGTDYGNIMENDTHLEVANFEIGVRSKIMQEYNYIRDHSMEPLTTFMEYLRYQYMIDNVVLLISGLKSRRPMSKLLSMCHPLGMFEELQNIEVAINTGELFNAVLIDTPMAKFVSGIDEEEFGDMNVEIIRSLMYKEYLEDFHKFCKGLGGTTSEVMGNLLGFEADRRSIVITVNSLDSGMMSSERENLFPRCGQMYPAGLFLLSTSESVDNVRSVINHYNDYSHVFDTIEKDTEGLISLEDRFLMIEAKKNVLSFLQQFHYGVFYSYMKLKELECRNIIWIAECISQRQRDKINAYIPIPLE